MAMNNTFKSARTPETATSYVPGDKTVNTIGKMFPNNASNRPNNINGSDLGNGLGSFPKDLNQGLAKEWENIRLLAETFETHLWSRGMDGYRQIFDKVTIPLHANTLSMTFMRSSGIDERPETAAVKGLANSWNPTWNEVAITGSSIEISTNAYGRFYKKHRFADDISTVRWFEELARYFNDNAARTLNNLAGIRLYEGSNKMFVKTATPLDDTHLNAYTARITLAADASEVAANLTWDILREAAWNMQNYEETYNVVDGASGAIDSTTNKRTARIGGYYGDNYLVLLGQNGYNQLLNDAYFRTTFVANGGFYQQDIVNRTLGITSPVFQLQLQIVENPITIEKAASPKVFTDGQGALECAFVIGGANGARVGVELSLEGYTRMINVGYSDSKKIDPFELLAVVGWMSVTDFGIIANEAIYCVPYVKFNNIAGGNVVKPTSPTWKA